MLTFIIVLPFVLFLFLLEQGCIIIQVNTSLSIFLRPLCISIYTQCIQKLKLLNESTTKMQNRSGFQTYSETIIFIYSSLVPKLQQYQKLKLGLQELLVSDPGLFLQKSCIEPFCIIALIINTIQPKNQTIAMSDSESQQLQISFTLI